MGDDLSTADDRFAQIQHIWLSHCQETAMHIWAWHPIRIPFMRYTKVDNLPGQIKRPKRTSRQTARKVRSKTHFISVISNYVLTFPYLQKIKPGIVELAEFSMGKVTFVLIFFIEYIAYNFFINVLFLTIEMSSFDIEKEK